MPLPRHVVRVGEGCLSAATAPRSRGATIGKMLIAAAFTSCQSLQRVLVLFPQGPLKDVPGLTNEPLCPTHPTARIEAAVLWIFIHGLFDAHRGGLATKSTMPVRRFTCHDPQPLFESALSRSRLSVMSMLRMFTAFVNAFSMPARSFCKRLSF